MNDNPMKILIIEDDVQDCNAFIKCAKERGDIEIVAITDSDIEAIQYVKVKHPEGIVLDLELNNGRTGNADSFQFLSNLKELHLNYEPIVIVTTHISSKRTYEVLHKNGVELILYKDQPKYSPNHVFNNFLLLRNSSSVSNETILTKIENDEEKIINLIDAEMDLIGIPEKMVGRSYIREAIIYLIENEGNVDINAITYLKNKFKKSDTAITNGIQNAINYAWRISPTEDLEKYYTARVNYVTGVPTPMEFLYYYSKKIQKEM